MKKTKVLFFSLVLVMFALFFSGINFKAAEVQVSDAISVKGAQVRTSDPLGIRFVGTAEDEYDAYGIAIAFGDVSADEVVLGATVNGKAVLNAEVDEKDEDNQFYISLISIPQDMYVQDVTARAYVVKEGVYTYATTVVVRNLAQVSLAVKNAGGEVVDSVLTYVEENYMKTYQVGDYVYVNNSLYEYEPTALAELFVEDFNKVTGENISSMKDFAFTYKLVANSSATKEVVLTSKLYQFFNANNQEMLAKWGWVLDFIKSVDNNQFSLAQMAICKVAEKDLAESYSDWYGMQHLLSRFESFFTRGIVANNGLSYQSRLFYDPAKYDKLISTMDSLEQKFYTVKSYDFVEIGKTITLPEYEVAAGYEKAGYFDGTSYFIDEYVASKTNVTLVPMSSIIEYKIVFMNAENEITELAKTYTINDQITLPESYLVDGFIFEGWYDNKDFTGNPITSIESGSIGNKVFYAKLTEKTGFNVEYNFNGGNTTYKNKAEVIADLYADITTYRGSTTTPTSIGAHSGAWTVHGIYKMFQNETYYAKWEWLLKHFAETETNSYNKVAFKILTGQSTTTFSADTHQYSVEYVLAAFGNGYRHSLNANFITADYGLFENNQIWDNLAAVEPTRTLVNQKTEVTLLKDTEVYKPGYTFAGWYTTEDFQEGTNVTTVSSDAKLYAKWVENATSTTVELSSADEAAITSKTPDIVVSNQFVSGTYVVNGVQYVVDETAFSTIDSALRAASEGANIYVFAGSYNAPLTISTANITIYGPNSGIKGYADNRNNEASILHFVEIKAAGVTLNGLAFNGKITKTVKVSDTSYYSVILNYGNDFSFINNYVTSATSTVIIAPSSVSNFKLESNFFNWDASLGGSGASYWRPIRMFGTSTNVDFTNNKVIQTIKNDTKTGLYDIFHITSAAGVVNINGNDITGYSYNWNFNVADAKLATEINFNNNKVYGVNGGGSTTLNVGYMGNATNANFCNNEIKTDGTTYSFDVNDLASYTGTITVTGNKIYSDTYKPRIKDAVATSQVIHANNVITAGAVNNTASGNMFTFTMDGNTTE